MKSVSWAHLGGRPLPSQGKCRVDSGFRPAFGALPFIRLA